MSHFNNKNDKQLDYYYRVQNNFIQLLPIDELNNNDVGEILPKWQYFFDIHASDL